MKSNFKGLSFKNLSLEDLNLKDLISRNLNPEDLRKSFEASKKDRSELTFSIAPTYECNCRCVYCYEQDKAKSKGIMSAEIEKAIYDFIAKLHSEQKFKKLSIQWYGGEPTLCIKLIEKMSKHILEWCGKHDVKCSAFMLSNGVLIDSDVVSKLVECHIESVMLTIDGFSDLHNIRRPAVGVQNPFEKIMNAIKLLQEAEIQCLCVMNTDKVNAEQYFELRDQLKESYGIDLYPARLCDYAHTFGHDSAYSKPEFDLFTHAEYCDFLLERFKKDGASETELEELLSPCDHFCNGQKENYFVIDAKGDVYKCDGWMGDESKKIFNLLSDEPILDAIVFDPFQDKKCSTCDFLSICWGNCSWERELTGWPCHPLKYSLPEYIKAAISH